MLVVNLPVLPFIRYHLGATNIKIDSYVHVYNSISTTNTHTSTNLKRVWEKGCDQVTIMLACYWWIRKLTATHTDVSEGRLVTGYL